MAKTGFWLRGARGKFAGAAFQKGPKGSTVQREVVTPKNPKTRQQLIQRAIMATVMNGYSALKDICDHSFEGVTYGADSMYMFNKLNAKKLRAKVANAAAIHQIAGCAAFTKLGTGDLAPAPFIVSRGSLPKVQYVVGVNGWNAYTIANIVKADAYPTYQELADSLGLQRGDQLTFVGIWCDEEGKYTIDTKVLILDPYSNGAPTDMSVQAYNHDNILNPNPGTTITNFEALSNRAGADTINLSLFVPNAHMVAGAVIASRKQGNDWLRSDADMFVNLFNAEGDVVTILQAIASQYKEIEGESDYILNGATSNASTGDVEFNVSVNNETATTEKDITIDDNLTSIRLVGAGSAGVGAAKIQTLDKTGFVDSEAGSWSVSGSDLVWSGTIEQDYTPVSYYISLEGFPVVMILLRALPDPDDGE